MFQMRSNVACPYCGARINLGDKVGEWVERCTQDAVYGMPAGYPVQQFGCGKSFVVRARRRVAYRSTAHKIEGEQ